MVFNQRIQACAIIIAFLITPYAFSQDSILYPELEEQTPEVFEIFDKKREKATEDIQSHSSWDSSFQSVLESFETARDRAGRESAIFYGSYAYTNQSSDQNPIGILKRVEKEKFTQAKDSGTLDSLKWDSWLDLDEFVNSVNLPGQIDQPDLGQLNCYFNPVTRERERCLIVVNQSGSDRNVFYEYDIGKKSFVEDGFKLEVLGNHSVSWVNSDTLSVRLDRLAWHNYHNPNDQVTDREEAIKRGLLSEMGAPPHTYLWRRGNKLDVNRPLLTTESEEHFTWIASGLPIYGQQSPLDVLIVGSTLSRIDYRAFVITDDNGDGNYSERKRIDIPDRMRLSGITYDGTLIFQLHQDWKQFKDQDIVSVKVERRAEGGAKVGDVRLVYRPDTPREFVSEINTISKTDSLSDDYIVLLTMENVNHKVKTLKRTDESSWSKAQEVNFPDTPQEITASFQTRNEFLRIRVESFTTPPATYEANVTDSSLEFNKFDQAPPEFDGDRFKTTQLWIDRGVDSKTGRKIRVPYYVVYDPDKVDLDNNEEPNKTLLYAYAGHGNRTGPSYLGALFGKNWLEQGGVYVLANPRGGGEFGQWWYEMSIGEGQKDRAEDFNAVAQDLIQRGIATPQTLGAYGGSNGGLLMGLAVTQRPDLFGAVQIHIPILDMMRFHVIGDGRGRGYINEFGDPDGAERHFWQAYSPVHALRENVNYPKIMLFANRFDDRTHPAHARKFSKRLDELEVDHHMIEWPIGGHGGASAPAAQRVEPMALRLVFFHKALGLD